MAEADARETLLALLSAHHTMGPDEARHLERMLEHAQTAAAPFDRHASPGHFTASALVVSEDMDQVLLMHHRKLDKWLQCGGHIDAEDPHPSSAALRETLEETGLTEIGFHPLWDGLLDVDVHRIPNDPAIGAHDHFDLRYLLVADPDAPLARSETETKDLKWCSWEEAARLVDDHGLERILAKVQRIQRHVKGL